MKYLTGIHALNLNCKLETCGDWHQSGLKWENLTIKDTNNSLLGDWGLEFDMPIPDHKEKFTTANHIRALIDLLELGNFALAQGMREDFICNETYNEQIFEKVLKLSVLPHWKQIDEFMEKEYMLNWINYKKEKTDAGLEN